RTKLILPQLHHLRLQLTQPRSDLRLTTHSHTHRQTVDEQSDHLLNARQLRRPSGYGRTKQHIFITAVATQQQRPSSLQHRVHRHLLLACEALYLLAPVHAQPQFLFCMYLRGRPAIRTSLERKASGRGEACEGIAPVSFSSVRVLLFQPDDVISERTWARQFQRLAAAAGFIKSKHFL